MRHQRKRPPRAGKRQCAYLLSSTVDFLRLKKERLLKRLKDEIKLARIKLAIERVKRSAAPWVFATMCVAKSHVLLSLLMLVLTGDSSGLMS